MSRAKYLGALLLVASSTAFAADFESVSEFRQCGKDKNSLEESSDKLDSTLSELKGFDLRYTLMRTMIETQQAWVADYNARVRLNADISEFNALVNEMRRRAGGYRRNIKKYNERVDEFNRTCIEDRSVDMDGDIYKEVCMDTNKYYSWCQKFKKN